MIGTVLAPATLETERLRLRRFRAADAALVELYCSDRRVAWMTERIPHPYPPGLAEAFVARVGAGSADEVTWAIDACTADDDECTLIGAVVLRLDGEGAARIGYWLAPAFWGTGYAGEAVEAVIGQARALGLGAITARVFQDNPASVRVLVRAGFAYEGDGEVHSLARGGMVEAHLYRLDLAGAAA